MRAVAITDRNTLAGVVRAHRAAEEIKETLEKEIRCIVGARRDVTGAPSLLVYPTDRAAYGRLTRLLTIGKRRAPKAECRLTLDDVLAHAEGQVVVALPAEESPILKGLLHTLAEAFPSRTYLAGHCL